MDDDREEAKTQLRNKIEAFITDEKELDQIPIENFRQVSGSPIMCCVVMKQVVQAYSTPWKCIHKMEAQRFHINHFQADPCELFLSNSSQQTCKNCGLAEAEWYTDKLVQNSENYICERLGDAAWSMTHLDGGCISPGEGVILPLQRGPHLHSCSGISAYLLNSFY